MPTYVDRIEAKYKRIAKIPEVLLSFTIPIRKQAIGYLNLADGSAVIDVGCGTGSSFQYIEEIIGDEGKILGVEPSKSMISGARERVKREGWKNIILSEATIEDVHVEEMYDGALLFAMHDVFNSMEGLKKIHALLKDGGRIACVGPRLQEQRFFRIFNPFLNVLFRRMAISQENKYRPWQLVESLFVTEKMIELKHGLIFIYVGRK
jgi:ubiquinone/menaquinone biosynthesis C-methylase UbiE